MIGIATRYRKCDSTFAATAIARRLDSMARRYSILGYDWRADCIDPAFDNRVHKIPFQQWLSKLTHIIWTAPVDHYFVHQAQQRGIRSTLYTSWEQFEPYDEKHISDYTYIALPSLIQAMQLRDRFKIHNVAVIPYDSGLPHTLKLNTKSSQIRLFFSLFGAQLRRVELSAVTLLADIVRDNPHIDVTIACSKGLASYTQQELKKHCKQFAPRWNVLWNCSWPDQAIQMGEHDLTVWPAKLDGMGLIGMTSLAMGTPVISWDITPINEHLLSGRNSILVSSPVEYNWLGVPQVKPDYAEFDRVLRWLLDRPDAIAELRKHTTEQLDDKRVDFKKGWDAILPVAL